VAINLKKTTFNSTDTPKVGHIELECSSIIPLLNIVETLTISMYYSVGLSFFLAS